MYSVRVKSELLVCVFSRFWVVFENASKEKRELLFIVTPSFSVIRTNGLEPSRCYSLEPETSASTNSATCALLIGAGELNHNSSTNARLFLKKIFSFLVRMSKKGRVERVLGSQYATNQRGRRGRRTYGLHVRIEMLRI